MVSTSLLPVKAADMRYYPQQSIYGYQAKYARGIQTMLFYYNSTTRTAIRNSGGVDGTFGNGTHSAVLTFQYSTGLAQDGIVGNASWTKFRNTLRYADVDKNNYYRYKGNDNTSVCMRQYKGSNTYAWYCAPTYNNWHIVG